uniref:ING domain-containing protein n=1 Tax=Ascaris lumbricoides TaxID=6252 RepID=A0A0M3IAG5_ASCLU
MSTEYYSLLPAAYEIKQLMKMISDINDRKELAILAMDRLSTRSEIKQNVDKIIARQPIEVQDAYVNILRNKIINDNIQYENEMHTLKEKGASNEVLEVKKQMHMFESDWSLSKQDAEQMEKRLVAALSKSQRDLLDF